ncbi:MAG: glutamate 5-kinase [Deltaproteobacteria bacterium]|nr:MAG: glutamate 5-kinase [Deltaproteobacteria bacterium]
MGQVRLMGLWETGFARLGRHAAQLLLTQDDFDDRARYLELRAAVSALLAHGVVPIVNENDVVRTDELRFVDALPDARPVFGDNDKLSALVATKLGADLLILLTDVEGVYARDPRQDPDAPLLSELSLDGRGDAAANNAAASTSDPTVDAGGAGSDAGRGGMASKLAAARIAARSGCHVVIASGRQPDNLPRILRGEVVGTWCPARPGLDARRRWIAFATAPRGVLHLDAGAVAALRQRGASLLAAGVTAVEGAFSAGEVVLLRGPDGAEVGRGAVSCDATTARAWSAGHAPSGTRRRHALVHRDQMVLEPE